MAKKLPMPVLFTRLRRCIGMLHEKSVCIPRSDTICCYRGHWILLLQLGCNWPSTTTDYCAPVVPAVDSASECVILMCMADSASQGLNIRASWPKSVSRGCVHDL